jgi:hypothetical protein
LQLVHDPGSEVSPEPAQPSHEGEVRLVLLVGPAQYSIPILGFFFMFMLPLMRPRAQRRGNAVFLACNIEAQVARRAPKV